VAAKKKSASEQVSTRVETPVVEPEVAEMESTGESTGDGIAIARVTRGGPPVFTWLRPPGTGSITNPVTLQDMNLAIQDLQRRTDLVERRPVFVGMYSTGVATLDEFLPLSNLPGTAFAFLEDGTSWFWNGTLWAKVGELAATGAGGGVTQAQLTAAVAAAVAALPPAESSAANPLTHADPPVTSQTGGAPIGLAPDGVTFVQPEIVAAFPVVVDGVEYLIPLLAK